MLQFIIIWKYYKQQFYIFEVAFNSNSLRFLTEIYDVIIFILDNVTYPYLTYIVLHKTL